MKTVSSMMLLAMLASSTGCLTMEAEDEVQIDPEEFADKSYPNPYAIPDIKCNPFVATGSAKPWRNHVASSVVSYFEQNHRGYDLIAPSDANTQYITGKIAYGMNDKDLEDEDVEVFACKLNKWVSIGIATTDDDGVFSIKLEKDKRLAIGIRDMYVNVLGDNTGATFLAMVAPDGSALAVSDVDGTLSSTASIFTKSLVTGEDVPMQPGAPELFKTLKGQGYYPVYLSSRSEVFTKRTRAWLEQKGMPRGPMRLNPDLFTLPGDRTVAYKTAQLDGLRATDMSVEYGNGNRMSDVSAYTNVGVDPSMITTILPEYEEELAQAMATKQTIGLRSYLDFVPTAKLLPYR